MSDAQLLFDDRLQERRPKLVELAYVAIKDAIRNGLFSPGFQGSELEIAQRLGMSRTPVHQAITQLQCEGMVDLKARRGVVIRALSPSDMREVYDVIIAVEGMAAWLICALPLCERESVCQTLDAINRETSDALTRDDLVDWAECDGRFHAALVAGAGNGRLDRIARINLDQSYRARRLTLRLRPKPVQSIGEHEAIIEAIRRGDASSARQATQLHKEIARDLIMELLQRYNMKHL